MLVFHLKKKWRWHSKIMSHFNSRLTNWARSEKASLSPIGKSNSWKSKVESMRWRHKFISFFLEWLAFYRLFKTPYDSGVVHLVWYFSIVRYDGIQCIQVKKANAQVWPSQADACLMICPRHGTNGGPVVRGRFPKSLAMYEEKYKVWISGRKRHNFVCQNHERDWYLNLFGSEKQF